MESWDERFIFATFDEVSAGLTTDVYFTRTRRILQKYGLIDAVVHAEITASKLPDGYKWAVFAGLREALKLLKGRKVTVRSMPEGEIFTPSDFHGNRVPVMTIEGPYGEFLELETPILGFLASASGIATKAARVKKAAGDKIVLSFGARRQHPALAPFIEYYAYIGGADGVSAVLGAQALGIRATGTMPHSLMVLFKALKGDHTLAWRAFDETVEEDVLRIVLADTFLDEVEESLLAAEVLGSRLWGVRLDTPGSRRGSLEEIVREVKWKLRARGFGGVKVVVSGGIDEYKIPSLIKAGADAFGVGAAISTAPPIDFAMDITAVYKDGEWVSIAKRGKLSGRKQVYRCSKCLVDVVTLLEEAPPKCPVCGGDMESLLETYIEGGELLRKPPEPKEVRRKVLGMLSRLEL
ncbi:nicotinate phosphoribosyltransferase [Infirmifilum lucidum]|uniref:nicotinate phosphoribosyltransferase n=1 Tax=Infirmifilum lucidum TaxID=2776706 RepID=A0A7L9FIB3_9CREN|nr:nicotinate phosphoribosyltransferase [Infirmifilum lucidum]QOJ79447.1 nicotinate phosphoribosyltransferase [Infirmifilum lucidum]